ncbi:hypothetical protein B0H63DRAFT_241178 [Podospora didyma]|uniref:DUF6594 domain-containing protein n=1 Tax=Podospora didyma TaxID=330526 RepID=A0AAE0KL29_9PEZI|nr:hypothetical protein B0H63DRAFT_241178 [Podospora didyma]
MWPRAVRHPRNHPSPYSTNMATGFAPDDSAAEKADITVQASVKSDYGSSGKDFDYPLGFSRIAALQEEFDNTVFFRKFKSPVLRRILYSEGRLAFLANLLPESDRSEDNNLRALTTNQTRLPGQAPIKAPQDDLMNEFGEEFVTYATLVSWFRKMEELHPVPQPQIEDIKKYLLDEDVLEKETYDLLMNPPEDMASIRRPLPRWMTKVIHGPVSKCIERFGLSWHPNRSLLVGIGRCTQIAAAIPLVTLPVGIMFLYNLGKAASFGVAVGFTVVFAVVMMAAAHDNKEKTLVGICAYWGILMTIAAQLAAPTNHY